MDNRTQGIVAGVVGLVLVVASVIGLLSRGGDDSVTAVATPSPSTPPTEEPSDAAPATATPAPTTAAANPTATAVPPTATPVPPTPTSVPPTATPVPPTPTPTPDPEVLTLDWIEQQSTAFVGSDVETLLARLHPATVERYGEEQCRTYLTGILPSPALAIREYLGMEPWDFATDGQTLVFDDAIAVEVERDINSQTIIQEVHYVLVEGEVRWFSDCGDPVS